MGKDKKSIEQLKNEADMKALLMEYYMRKIKEQIKLSFAIFFACLFLFCFVFIAFDPFGLNQTDYKYNGEVSYEELGQYQQIVVENKDKIVNAEVSYYKDTVSFNVVAKEDIGLGLYTTDKHKPYPWLSVEMFCMGLSLCGVALLFGTLDTDNLKG